MRYRAEDIWRWNWMAGEPRPEQSFIDRLLAAGDVPYWIDAGELSRISMESFAAREGVGRPRPFGAIRLSGAGVRGHAAPLDVVGALCQEFQRLVVATGASLEG